MNIHVALITTLLALGATAASAADKPAGATATSAANTTDRQCFWTRQANGFAAQDDRTVNVRVSSRDVYQFQLMGHCPDIDWSQQIALVSHSGDSICSGLDAEIVTRSPIGPMRCPVSHIRKLTPEEIAALPRKARP